MSDLTHSDAQHESLIHEHGWRKGGFRLAMFELFGEPEAVPEWWPSLWKLQPADGYADRHCVAIALFEDDEEAHFTGPSWGDLDDCWFACDSEGIFFEVHVYGRHGAPPVILGETFWSARYLNSLSEGPELYTPENRYMIQAAEELDMWPEDGREPTCTWDEVRARAVQLEEEAGQ